MTAYFHTTDHATAILREGFRDDTGSYMLVGATLTGVFLSDAPVDSNEGATGDQLLEVRLPDDLDLADYELVEDDGGAKGYREWCVPAQLLNEQASIRLLVDDEADTAWLRRYQDGPVTDPAPGR